MTESEKQRLIEALSSGEEYRNAYAESVSNSQIAAQIKAIREQRGMEQGDLAAKIGTKQPGISRFENVNYSAWNVRTLRRIAAAFGLRLKITFEEFGTLPGDLESFNRAGLQRRKFDDDPVFFPRRIPPGSEVSAINPKQQSSVGAVGRALSPCAPSYRPDPSARPAPNTEMEVTSWRHRSKQNQNPQTQSSQSGWLLKLLSV